MRLVREQVDSQPWNWAYDQVNNRVQTQVYDQIETQVWDEVGSQLNNPLQQVWRQLLEEAREIS